MKLPAMKDLRKSLPLPVLIGAAVLLAAELVWAGFAYYNKKDVTIHVDGRTIAHRTFKDTVGDLLKEEKITLGPKDAVNPPLTAKLRDGMRVEVSRAFLVKVIVGGKNNEVVTAATTVKGVLQDAGVVLAPLDLVTPRLESAVRPGSEIKVVRVEESLVTEQYELPFATERKLDNSLEKGRSRVVQQGAAGLAKRTVKVTYHDGQEAKRNTVTEEVIRPATDTIIAVGNMATVSRGGDTFSYRRVLDMVATAYTAGTGQRTSAGYLPRVGVAAVDPAVIPIGTRLYVDGYGYATALDIGGDIKGNRIDVFFPDEATCNRWGRRSVQVYLLQ